MPSPRMPPSPTALVERFGAVMDRFPSVERRKMFGYPAAFIGGNLVTSLHGSNWVIRLGDAARAELMKIEGAGPFEPMAGRPMKGFAVVPPAVVADDAALNDWLERAFEHARAMPAKK